MKNSKLFIAGVFMLLISVSSCTHGQNSKNAAATKTVAINVSGNCEMCKQRIETAAKVDGVSKADWDINSRVLTLVYDSTKVSSDDVQKKIAAVGHDTEKYKADDQVYDALPSCCKYR